jgi:hypothetical protein
MPVRAWPGCCILSASIARWRSPAAGASAFTGTVHVLDIGAPAAILARFGVGR